ncbi:MAG: class I SAM-dependent methyltransferase [bacterium]|nr:class I SAM-dependent methyltransferase [bacterium]
MHDELNERIRAYWNERIHDLAVATSPPGSEGFFRELEAYRFEKLDYLPRAVRFDGYAGRRVLEIGCGIGLDLARFATGGARVTGVDLAPRSIELARTLFRQRGLEGDLRVMDGAALEFPDGSFDVAYAHGTLQYAADPGRIVAEMRRVLVPGGEAIAMLYNRRSWLSVLSRIMKVELEHEDAPVLRLYTIREARRLFGAFGSVRILPERFPVRTRLHGGWKGALYNAAFVRCFDAVPRPLVRRWGWHIMIFARR